MELRNNFICHGGNKGYEHNPVVVALSDDLTDKKIIEIYDNPMSLVDIDSQIENFEELVTALIKYVGEKCDVLYTKISNEIFSTDIEELYKLAIDLKNYELIDIKVNMK